MPLPDNTAKAYLSAEVLRFCRLGLFDFYGDSLRATDAPYSLNFSGSSDSDLNGNFFAIDHQMVNLSPISHTSENSNTLTVTLSGLINIDSDLMTLLGDRDNWVGRKAVVWYMLMDPDGNQVGTPWRHYTGKMINVKYLGGKDSSSIQVQVENYLAVLSEASRRSYLSQQEFDSGDLSAAASIASANSRNPSAVTPAQNFTYGDGYSY